MRRSEMDAALQALYDQIPAIPGCDGRCWTSCGAADMSDRERQRIRAAGYKITPYEQALARPERYWCEALTPGKRCAVYELRPMVCRLWGAVEGLECIYGCVPEGGRWLPEIEGYRLIIEAMRIGGSAADMRMDPAGIDARLAQQGIRSEIERIRARGLMGERRRADEATIPAAFRRSRRT